MSDADLMIYCRKYHCSMHAQACINRHNFMVERRTKAFKDYDPGCVDCEQVRENRKLLEEYKAKEKNMSETEVTGITEKFCPSCQQTLPSEKFYRDARRPTGLSSWCKICQRTAQKKRDEAKKAAERRAAAPPPDQADTGDQAETKVCTQCGEEKPIGEFHRDWKQGRKSACKACRNHRTRVYESKVNAGPTRVSVDFSGYEGILAAIRQQAKVELRHPDQQIIWLLAKQLERKVS